MSGAGVAISLGWWFLGSRKMLGGNMAWPGARRERPDLGRVGRDAERAGPPTLGEGSRGAALVQPFISFK